MKSRLTKGDAVHYDHAEWNGTNESGCYPLGDVVLVLPDQASEKIGKLGLLIQPKSMQESMSVASESGVVVAVGDGAFKWSRDRTRPFAGRAPKAGDRVLYRRYAGQLVIGADRRTYRYMSDSEIGVIEDAAAMPQNISADGVAVMAETV